MWQAGVGVVSREHRGLDDALQHAHCFPFFMLQVAEQQYKRIVSEAESKFINVLTSDRAPQHRSLESSSKSQQYSKRLHRSKPPFILENICINPRTESLLQHRSHPSAPVWIEPSCCPHS
jgi:hypothetical protein